MVNLATLTVPELNKYLDHYQLSKTGRKNDKMGRIIAHYTSARTENKFQRTFPLIAKEQIVRVRVKVMTTSFYIRVRAVRVREVRMR